MADAKRIIRMNYNAYLADEDRLFDTTNADAAKEAGIYNEKYPYVPMPYIVGSTNVLAALNDAIANAEVGKETEVIIPCENAAGPKDPAKIELHQLKEFTSQKINPYPGLVVSLGNKTGVVQTVSGGRVKIDFNNQLCGHDLRYVFTIVEEVADADKGKAILDINFGTSEGFDIVCADGKVTVYEPDVCKFHQNWPVAKYKIVNDLRQAYGVTRVDFVQTWDIAEKKE
jgi:FKBP-type peptidyl-prolyl cis-trans isomerase 2